ncbi:C-type lectin domain family 10 member A-like [Mercenaria mercenaria]|uniref:C-type lectin domain family 10 member A-like n=1 Tax=Mercenaria mercenaria TaxID=6596 RepID=UPI00234F0204|nr:C-type lectin domain family 10 member A-like [Mercenaria mercenaria]
MNGVTLAFYIVICVTVPYIQGAPTTTDVNGTEPGDMNGKKLMEIGKKLKLPKLRLIGKTIENLELKVDKTLENFEKKTGRKMCDLNPCMAWTDWSKCSSNPHRFGSKVRTRQCSINKDTCKVDTANSRTETEFGVCGGFCPKDYNVTKNGFCVKLYSDKTRTQVSAEQQCQDDGGHLMNIDSEEKYEDVSSLLKGFGSYVWIDGRRKDVSSPWEYKYGSQKGFFKWRSGEPDNNSNDLCLFIYLYSGTVFWYDYPCGHTYYALCEII